MKTTIYVGNLPFSTTEDDLRQIFTQVGTVLVAKIIFDRQTGMNKGFGFVEFENEADAQAAIQRFHGADYDGKTIRVSIANGPKDMGVPSIKRR